MFNSVGAADSSITNTLMSTIIDNGSMFTGHASVHALHVVQAHNFQVL